MHAWKHRAHLYSTKFPNVLRRMDWQIQVGIIYNLNFRYPGVWIRSRRGRFRRKENQKGWCWTKNADLCAESRTPSKYEYTHFLTPWFVPSAFEDKINPSNFTILDARPPKPVLFLPYHLGSSFLRDLMATKKSAGCLLRHPGSIVMFACFATTWSSQKVIACNPCEIQVIHDHSSSMGGHSGRLSVRAHSRTPVDPVSPVTSPAENIAWARYWSTYEVDGWDRLEVAAVPDVPVPDSLKAMAVGYAEGHLQYRRVYDYWTNYRCGSTSW